MPVRLKEKYSNCYLVLSKRQPDLYVLHHSDCSSLFSDNLDDDRYVKIQSVVQAKKIADMDDKPIMFCSICNV